MKIHGESSGNPSQSGWLGGRCQISYLSSLELLSESSPESGGTLYLVLCVRRRYHGVVKDKLRQLWKAITEHHPSNNEARVFTDSAPLLERYWAWKAGLGWIGKNTNLIIPGKGSFFFLGEIVTTFGSRYL